MSLQMKVEELDGNRAVITLQGPFILGMSLRLADSQIQSLILKGVNKLLLDMSDVPYSDSSGLGVLVHTFGLVKQKGGMLRLCCLSEKVANLLKTTTTDTLLTIDANREAGIAALA